MADVAQLLGPAIDAVDMPRTVPELIDAVGGRDEAIRALSGLSGPPRKGDYADADQFAADRTRWRTASRRVQRATTTTGTQRRGTSGKPITLEGAARDRVEVAARDTKLARMFGNGVRARLHVTVSVPSPLARRSDRRDRWLPSGGLGIKIEVGALGEVIGAFDDGDQDRAAFEFLVAFADAYGAPIEFDIEETHEVKVWPDGEPEP